MVRCLDRMVLNYNELLLFDDYALPNIIIHISCHDIIILGLFVKGLVSYSTS